MTTTSLDEITRAMCAVYWFIFITLIVTIISFDDVLCSIDSTFIPRQPNATKAIDDPCNSLYWYPRTIPEYCYYKKETPHISPIRPVPHILPPHSIFPPSPMIPPIIPPPFLALPYPLPFGIPLAPTNPMLPVAGIPYSPQPYCPPPPMPPPIISPFASYVPPWGIQRRPMSMVPGLPGLVAPDGGINILPFSDAYADLLEKHKQKMIRRRLQKLLDEYDEYPRRSSKDDKKRIKTRRLNIQDNIDESDTKPFNDNDIYVKGDHESSEIMKMDDYFKKHDFLNDPRNLM